MVGTLYSQTWLSKWIYSKICERIRARLYRQAGSHWQTVPFYLPIAMVFRRSRKYLPNLLLVDRERTLNG